MGINLKKIFKEDEEELVINRSNRALRALIIMAVAVVVFIVFALVIKFAGDKDELRRSQLIQDIKVVRSAIENKSNEYSTNPTTVSLIGASLSETPITIVENGIEEEYRYGYYWITPEDLIKLTNAVNLPQEYYIVNYDTYDVVNYNGVTYNKVKYHSIDDLLLVEKGMTPAAKQIIRTANDLEKMRANPNGYFKLSGNLDMSSYSLGEGWTPIESFGGTLDGRGYTISNLTISRPSSNNVGLFGTLASTANITNLKLDNVNVRGGQFVGALAGSSAGNINHVTIGSGSVIGQTDYTGGLVGSHDKGTISNCVVMLDSINGNSEVGGLIGILYSGTVTKSGAKTNIIGRDGIGGAIGNVSISSATYIQEIAANTQMTGTSDLGGLIGKIEILTSQKLELGNSYAKGAINGTNQNSGGIVGSVSSVGAANIEFKSLYTTLDILEKAISSGGCIGHTDIAITSAVSVADCFWEKDLAPGEELRSVGTKAADTFTLSFDSKTYDEMRIRNTFVNWNFDIWAIAERQSTPYLKWEI